MKKIICLVITMAILLGVTACPSFAESISSSENSALTTEKVNVYVIGEYQFTDFMTEDAKSVSSVDLTKFSVSTKKMNSLTECSTVIQEPSAIVVSDEIAKLHLEKLSDNLLSYLDTGHVVYFPETLYERMDEVLGCFSKNVINMTPVDNSNEDLVTVYAFKDSSGELYTGSIIAPNNTPQAVIDAQIISETCRNQEIIANGKEATAEKSSLSPSFNVGVAWNALTSWHKNVYVGDYTNYAWFSEWICFFSALLPTGEHCYAWAGEWSSEGAFARSNYYVRYQSDADMYNTGGQLRAYDPKQTPETASASFSAGIDSDAKYNFGFSMSWNVSELKLLDQSSPGYEYCKLYWYMRGQMMSNTCTGKFYMIFFDTEKTGSYTFHHFRDAAQTHADETDIASGNYYTTLSFIP